MKKLIFTVIFSAFFFSFNVFSTPVPHTIHGVTTINIYQAKRLHDLGVPFLDVRPTDEWRWGHISQAHNLSLHEKFQELKSLSHTDRNTPIIIYGNSSNHMPAAIASYLASLWGYERIFFLRDGYYKWLAKDLPVTFNTSLLP